MKNPNLTFCSVFRNEEMMVRHVLDWGKALCADMILGVQKSEDDTLKICREYTDKIVVRPPEPPELTRDFVIEKVKTPWTFWLDADEIPSLELIHFLERFHPMDWQPNDAIKIPRINYINGKRIEANEAPDSQFRIIRNDVRWKPEEQGQNAHIYPIVKDPAEVDYPIYHHRSLKKIRKMTKRWNELEPKTKEKCNRYFNNVIIKLAESRS